MKRHGIHFVHASDEWYLLAGRKLPEEEQYDGYLQLENGVGMLRLLLDEVDEALESLGPDDRKEQRTIATGRLAAPYIQKCVEKIQRKFPGVQVEVIPVENRFFGETITVSGLLTGQDLREQLSGRIRGDALLLPCNMLRSGEDVFLDDVTTEHLERELETRIVIVDESGADFVDAVLNAPVQKDLKRRQMYEQTGSCDCGKA